MQQQPRDHDPLVSITQPGWPNRPRLVAALLVLAAIFAVVSTLARPIGRRAVPETVDLSVTPVEARQVLDTFLRSVNAGEIDTAFDQMGEVVRSNPERIQAFFGYVAPDFVQELEYAWWNAALGAEWLLERCSTRRWVRLHDGVRLAEDAQLLSCTGTYTSDFFTAIEEAPMPADLTVAVDGDLEIVLYQAFIHDNADTRVYLEFRRWIREQHPGDELRVFTPGGTPVTTAEGAKVMMGHASAFAVDRRDATD